MYISNKYPLYKWMKSAQDDIEEAHEAVEKVAEVYEARRVVSNGEAWNMELWCRDSRRNTFDIPWNA